jgi:protein-tyrosine phosphatase
VRSAEEGRQLLEALAALGFERVFATPHMRPGMFDYRREDLEAAFARALPAFGDLSKLPQLQLGCEHTFDSLVFDRILAGEGLPYPPGKAILIEFYTAELPPQLPQLLARIRRSGLTPVIAHPERVPALWDKPLALEELRDVGAATLLDTAALIGKYGKQAERTAKTLLAEGLYDAACSDAHRVADVALVAKGMKEIEKRYGTDELDALFRTGPTQILEGTFTP